MTRVAWQGLGWMVACMGVILGLVELAYWAGWAVAVGVGWGGIVLAGVLAEAWAPADPSPVVRVKSMREQRRDLVETGRDGGE